MLRSSLAVPAFNNFASLRAYGGSSWRKLKGKTRIRLRDGRVFKAEVHWYEAHGVGKKRIKIKRFLS
jgi:hypothetical protein